MSKRLLFLIGLLVLLVAAVVLSSKPEEGADGKENALIFPELQNQINDVRRITIAQGKSSFTLERDKKDVWRIKEKADFPADRGMIAELLDALSSTYFLEKRTAKKENYKALGLDEAFMRRIAVYGVDADKPLASIYVGLQKQARGGSFVRMPGEDQTWLAQYNLTAQTVAAKWLQKDLTEIPNEEIKQIVITQVGGPEVNVYREKPGGDIRLKNLPKDKKVRDPSALSNLFDSLNPLNIDDVRSAGELRSSSLQTARITMFDGREMTLRFNPDGSDVWTVVEASYHPVENSPAPDPKKKEAADPETFIKQLSKHTEGYAFMLPYTIRHRLTTKFSDLVE